MRGGGSFLVLVLLAKFGHVACQAYALRMRARELVQSPPSLYIPMPGCSYTRAVARALVQSPPSLLIPMPAASYTPRLTKGAMPGCEAYAIWCLVTNNARQCPSAAESPCLAMHHPSLPTGNVNATQEATHRLFCVSEGLCLPPCAGYSRWEGTRPHGG